MRILSYTDDIDGAGGAAAFVHDTALEMRRRGHEVGVATATWPHLQGPRQIRLAAGVKEIEIKHDFDGPDWARGLREVQPARVITEYRPDVIFFTDCAPGSNLPAKRVARRLGIPFVSKIALADDSVLEGFLALPPDRRDWGEDGLLVFLSEGNRRRSCAATGLDPDKTTVLPTGFPPATFAPQDAALRRARRAEAGIPDDAFLCLTVARIEERKGDWLLPLIAAKMPVASRIHFLWIGHDLQQRSGRLADSMASAGYGERYRYLPARPAPEIPSWMAAADVFLLPSYGEGLARVLVEAAAQARPIVTADVDGADEVVGDGCGEIVAMDRKAPEDTAGRFAAVLAGLERDPERRARLGAMAAARAVERFSLEGTMNGMEAAFSTAIRKANECMSVGRQPHHAGRRCFGLDNPVLDDAAMTELAGPGWGAVQNRVRIILGDRFALRWPPSERCGGAGTLAIRLKAIRSRRGASLRGEASGRRLGTWRLPGYRSRWVRIGKPREWAATEDLSIDFTIDWVDPQDTGHVEVSRIAFVPAGLPGWLSFARRVAAARLGRWIAAGRHRSGPVRAGEG